MWCQTQQIYHIFGLLSTRVSSGYKGCQIIHLPVNNGYHGNWNQRVKHASATGFGAPMATVCMVDNLHSGGMLGFLAVMGGGRPWLLVVINTVFWTFASPVVDKFCPGDGPAPTEQWIMVTNRGQFFSGWNVTESDPKSGLARQSSKQINQTIENLESPKQIVLSYWN